MLFAVEGGGFFSSSASGYSKGLTLLLLGQKNEEKPMRVTPWNQYQLVDQESESYLQLASGKKRPACGCASFVCFGRASAEVESPSPLKVEPTQNQESLAKQTVFEENEDATKPVGCIVVGNDKRTGLESSLKKAPDSTSITSAGSCVDDGKNNVHETLCENNDGIACQKERRKVQWMDTIGGELFEIREFEMSEDDESEGDFNGKNERTCSCRIM